MNRVNLMGVMDSLHWSIEALENLDTWETENIREAMTQVFRKYEDKGYGTEHGYFFNTVRKVLTGQDNTPPATECAYVLGKEETMKKLKYALEYFTKEFRSTNVYGHSTIARRNKAFRKNI